MTDFARSLIEFQRRFADDRAFAAYLAAARCPDGFRCPACGHDKGWELATKAFTWGCASYGRQTSVTAETFSATRLHAFVTVNVTPRTTAKTDGWPGYAVPDINDDRHTVGAMAAHIVLPWAHRIFAQLKRWALGVCHGLRNKHRQS